MDTSLSALSFTAERQVNVATTGYQGAPVLATFSDGSSIAAWWSVGQDGSGSGVYARRIDASGNPMGAEFRVNTTTMNDQGAPLCVTNADGSFAIYWQSSGQPSSSDAEIMGQRYDAAGTATGGEFQVNTTTGGYQNRPSMGRLIASR